MFLIVWEPHQGGVLQCFNVEVHAHVCYHNAVCVRIVATGLTTPRNFRLVLFITSTSAYMLTHKLAFSLAPHRSS